MRRDAGFTLLEILVALAIFAIAAGGFLAASSQSLQQLRRLEDKTLAEWVAENKLTEMRANRLWPAVGVTQESADFAGRRWLLRIRVTQTPHEHMRKMEVSVGQGEEALATLTGFAGRF